MSTVGDIVEVRNVGPGIIVHISRDGLTAEILVKDLNPPSVFSVTTRATTSLQPAPSPPAWATRLGDNINPQRTLL
jgi:hypothetical protein